MKKPTSVPVVVTTAHKGVFFGYAKGLVNNKASVRLEKVRMCVYWSADVKGVLGLASTGPNKNCRITLAVPAMTLHDITGVMECSSESVDAWEKEPWS